MKKLLLSLLCVILTSQFALTQSTLDSGLVAYYPFNGNANDTSINHNNGTVYNATLTTDRFGNPNRAYSFNGTNAYITASANTLPNTVRTISLWFYANNVTSHPVLLGYGGNGNCAQGTSFMMALNVANSNKYSTISHCAIKDMNAPYTTVPINQWIHWVVVANGTSTKFYLNGVLYKDSSVVYNNTYTTSTNLAFGTGVGWNGIAPFSDGNIGYLNGKLDDIRIYNRELSTFEILSLYNYQSCPSSLKFFGSVAEGVVIPYSNSINSYGTTKQITITAWVMLDSLNRNNRIAHKMRGNCVDDYYFELHADNKLYFAYNGGCLGDAIIVADTIFQTNKWYHTAIVMDGRTGFRNMKMYINGNLSATINMPVHNPLASNIPLVLGSNRHWDGTNERGLAGRLSEIQYYNRALSVSELADRRARILNMNSNDTIGLIAYWSLNGNSIDASANHNDGVVNGISQISCGHPFLTIPATPTLLSPSNHSINVPFTPTLFWNTVSGATSYKVQVSTNTGFTNIVDSATVTTNQRTIPAGKLNLASTYYWRVNASNANGTGIWSEVWDFTTIITGVQKITSEIPNEFKLYNNYPNPYNPSTKIKFDVARHGESSTSDVKIVVYDVMGREVQTIVNERMLPGTYEATFDGSKLNSGVYFYKMITKDYLETRKMLLIK